MASLFGIKSARLYAIGIAFSFTILIAFTPPSLSLLDELLLQALTSASWIVAGLAALSSARDLERKDREEGILALVLSRGHAANALELSRALAASLLIALRVGLPLLILVTIAWFKLADLERFRWFVSWSAFITVYALALGLVLGVLARVAARISPDRGRIVLVLLIALPELGRVLVPNLPTVPSAFGWALDRARSTPTAGDAA